MLFVRTLNFIIHGFLHFNTEWAIQNANSGETKLAKENKPSEMYLITCINAASNII
jgi:hypothetical protein